MTADTNALITRAVIDTNAVLDWLVFGEADATTLGSAIARGEVAWLVTPRLLDELRRVLARPLADRWEVSRKHALTIDWSVWATACEEPCPASLAPSLSCRDPSDQMFIDLALAQAPAWLVTRDRALLALRRGAARRGVQVGTPAQWLRPAGPAAP